MKNIEELRKDLVGALNARDTALEHLSMSLELLRNQFDKQDAHILAMFSEFDAQALKEEKADLANDHEKVADMLTEDTLGKSDDMGLDANNER